MLPLLFYILLYFPFNFNEIITVNEYSIIFADRLRVKYIIVFYRYTLFILLNYEIKTDKSYLKCIEQELVETCA